MKYIKLKGCDACINLEQINGFTYIEHKDRLAIYKSADENIIVGINAKENYQLLLNAVTNNDLVQTAIYWLESQLEINGEYMEQSDIDKLNDAIEYLKERM